MVVLVDKRSNRLPAIIEVRHSRTRVRDLPDPATVGSSWIQNKIAQRYPWLKGMGDKKSGEDTWLSEGSVIWVDDQEASPLTFVATFPPTQEQPQPQRQAAVTTAPVVIPDLLLAMVCIGSDDQIYWAHRLQG
ncbi:hypothetical protein [Micromonospora sp. IBHARD004]|uniref:hypothetical protein n=1 Tax=Micromonospora sp. IBHARD004 TaxID=3457764 RepID=UPI004058F746